jgi:hypothetical protein
MKICLSTLALAVFLCSTAASAQQRSDQGIKQDVKDAGKATGRAAKKTGKKVAKTTKKGVNKAAEGVEKGAGTVKEKTR